MRKWGFLRETAEAAKKAGIDKDTGLHRTGLDDYLKVIFPDISDWAHDKPFPYSKNGKKTRRRPDYRSDALKLIVEFDGLQHYTNPQNIINDEDAVSFYESCGYKVVRIPYFIQLSNDAVKTLFGVSVNEPLFDESIPSLGIKGQNTPAFLCPAGIERMKKEFMKFPGQFEVNYRHLVKAGNPFLSGIEFLVRQ